MSLNYPDNQNQVSGFSLFPLSWTCLGVTLQAAQGQNSLQSAQIVYLKPDLSRKNHVYMLFPYLFTSKKRKNSWARNICKNTRRHILQRQKCHRGLLFARDDFRLAVNRPSSTTPFLQRAPPTSGRQSITDGGRQSVQPWRSSEKTEAARYHPGIPTRTGNPITCPRWRVAGWRLMHEGYFWANTDFMFNSLQSVTEWVWYLILLPSPERRVKRWR